MVEDLQVRKLITETALSMIGWGYLYGATGWTCTEARVEQQANQYPAYAAQIRKYGLTKWLGKPCVDCAQLTKRSAKAAGISLPSGATSQWKSDVWAEKGTIDSLPDDCVGLFLYRESDGKMQHTGVCIGDGQAVEARGHAYGVILSKLNAYPWTHWARADAGNATIGNSTTGDVGAMLTGKICKVGNLKENTSTVRMRKRGSMDADTLTVIAMEESVQCISDNGTWAQCVYTGDGTPLTGFIMSKFLIAVGDAPTAIAPDASSDSVRLTLLEARFAALEEKVFGDSKADG